VLFVPLWTSLSTAPPCAGVYSNVDLNKLTSLPKEEGKQEMNKNGGIIRGSALMMMVRRSRKMTHQKLTCC
jgi:hypothetical protein